MYLVLVYLAQALVLLPENGGSALLPHAHLSAVQAPCYDDRGMAAEPGPDSETIGLPEFVKRHRAMLDNHIEIVG